METIDKNSVVLNCLKWLLEQVISNESIEKCHKVVIHCDNEGRNALMIAALFGYLDIVRYFVAETYVLVVNIKTKTKRKNTIHIVIYYSQTQIVQVLFHNIMKNLNITSKIPNGFDYDNQLEIDENEQKIENRDEFGNCSFNINEALELVIKYHKLMKYYKQNDFQMFQSLFDYENNVSSNVSQKQIENKKFEIEKSNQFCNLFYIIVGKMMEKNFILL